MPEVKIINDTLLPLHICLKQVSPLHYANNVHPSGGEAVFKPGPVWFTIEARIARIKDGGERAENEYTKWDTYVPIAAVSVAALSLGVGAVYIAGTAAATGSISALLASISTDMAASLPTVRRLYKYAKQGQRVVQVGQVIGIGGGSYLTNKLAAAPPAASSSRWKWFGKKSEKDEQAAQEEALKKQQKEAENSTAQALKNLLEGSVLSSHGWLMRKDRTLRIVGGPRATEMDGFLVIETDTYKPFRVVDEAGAVVGEGVEQVPDPSEVDEKEGAASAAEAVEQVKAEAATEQDKAGKDKEKAVPAWKERLAASLSSATTQANATFAEWKEYATQQAEAAQKYATEQAAVAQEYATKQAAVAQEYINSKRGKKTEGLETEKAAEHGDEKAAESAPSDAAATSAPADGAPAAAEEESATASDDPPPPQSESSPIDKLEEMGYTRQEARQALLRAQGDLEQALEWLLTRDKEEAVLRQSQTGAGGIAEFAASQQTGTSAAAPQDAAAGSASAAPAASSDPAAAASTAPAATSTTSDKLAVPASASTTASAGSSGASTPTTPGSGRLLPVKNAESVTQPHWTARAQETASGWVESAERAPLVGGAIRVGADYVRKKGDTFLSKDDHAGSSVARPAKSKK